MVHRIWVVQEVARSRSATVICGDETVPWDRCNVWLTRDYAGEPYGHYPPGILVYTSNMPVIETGLLYRLAHNRPAHCTDPRDKIVALLGLCSHEEQSQWEDLVDYERSAEQLFVSVAGRIMHRTNNLQILSTVTNISMLQFPSWVPDWSATNHYFSLGIGTADSEAQFSAGGVVGQFDVIEHVLSATGVLVSKITSTVSNTSSYNDDGGKEYSPYDPISGHVLVGQLIQLLQSC
jgi:hypothetical protein